MSDNLYRLYILLLLVLISSIDGTPRRSRVSQANKAFEEKDNKFEYSHSPGTIEEEETEDVENSDVESLETTTEASKTTAAITTTKAVNKKTSESGEKTEGDEDVMKLLSDIDELMNLTRLVEEEYAKSQDEALNTTVLLFDTHYKALDFNLTVNEIDECVRWQKYWNRTELMKNATSESNATVSPDDLEDEKDLMQTEEITSSKRLKAIGLNPEILEAYDKVIIFYSEVCGNHGRTWWYRSLEEAKQIGIDLESPICEPFKEKLNPDEKTLEKLAFNLNAIIQNVTEGLQAPLGDGNNMTGEVEFETTMEEPSISSTTTPVTMSSTSSTTSRTSITPTEDVHSNKGEVENEGNMTESVSTENVDNTMTDGLEENEIKDTSSIEVYDDDIYDYNDMYKRFKVKTVHRNQNGRLPVEGEEFENTQHITNEQLKSVLLVTKRRRKREVSSSENEDLSKSAENEKDNDWRTLKTITNENGDTTVTVVEEIHVHGSNDSNIQSWIKIDATDPIHPTLHFYSPDAINALGLDVDPKFFKRYENIGLYLPGICSGHVPKSVEEYNATSFGGDDGEKYNIGLSVADLVKNGVNITELAEKMRNDTEVDEILTRINGSTKNVGGSYVNPVLDKHKYDPSTAPIVFQGSAVTVRFGIYIESMSNFQTSTMDYDMDIYLMMAWRDVRLRHPFGGAILVKEEELLEKIWRPDPFFANAKEAEFHEVTFLNFLMRIFSDGLVLYETRVKIKPSCNLILCKYPHDKQTCDLLIKSFAYPVETVRFEWFSRRDFAIDKNPDVKLPELYIDRYETQNCPTARKSGSFSCLRAVFRLKRDVGFHIAQTYIPTSLALMFSWVGVWLPEEFMEGRIGVAITVLLTLSTESAGAREHLPSVSYLKAIDLWFGFITGFVFFTLLQTLFVIGFDKRSNQLRKWAGKKTGVEMNEETREALLQKATKYHKTGRYLDNFCRVFYPLSFILFLFMYYFVFTEGSQEDCMKR